MDGRNTAEPAWTRIWVYDPAAPVNARWSHIRWQLQPKPQNVTWVGLSVITLVDGGWILIERDNRTGDFGLLKTLVRVPLRPPARMAKSATRRSRSTICDRA